MATKGHGGQRGQEEEEPVLFCDPDFSPEDVDLPPDVEVERWLRPHELHKTPRMFVDGARRFDIAQGNLGDCWFLSSCGSVAEHPELIKKVIPGGQVLYGDEYDGAIAFRFWRMGRWQKVFIDDRLPVDGENKLVLGSCKNPGEFWLPLLEKAFAKFHGGYENLSGGLVTEGFVNLTGYSVESVPVENNVDLFKRLRKEWNAGSLITCARYSGKANQGLPAGHGYTVTGVQSVRVDTGGEKPILVRLVRVRNPYGEMEWTGSWRDTDEIWNKVDEKIKAKLEHKVEDDGEYWMKFAHFVQNFHDLCIGRKAPHIDEDQEEQYDLDNAFQQIRGRWIFNKTAGGSPKRLQSFAINPQFLIIAEEADNETNQLPQNGIKHVRATKNGTETNGSNDDEEEEEEEEEEEKEPTCHVLLELMQEHRRYNRKGLDNMAFFIYEAKEERRLTAADLEEMKADVVGYHEESSLQKRIALRPKVPYVVVVALDKRAVEKAFLLRVFSRNPTVRLEELPQCPTKGSDVKS